MAENGILIIPRQSEIDSIIKFYYETYKGEGARKLLCRIKQKYAGISRNRIQKWINCNKDHGKHQPVFNNKPPLKPVASGGVWNNHQIDLVDMQNYPVTD